MKAFLPSLWPQDEQIWLDKTIYLLWCSHIRTTQLYIVNFVMKLDHDTLEIRFVNLSLNNNPCLFKSFIQIVPWFWWFLYLTYWENHCVGSLVFHVIVQLYTFTFDHFSLQIDWYLSFCKQDMSLMTYVVHALVSFP